MRRRSSRVSVALVFSFALYMWMPIALRARQGRTRQMVGVPADQVLLFGSPPTPVVSGRQMLDAQNQLEVRLDVQRLYALATELKDEVDSTNSGAVLNVSVVKRARDIEKLARQIKDRVKR